MMRRTIHPARRGLTLIELLLALAITAMVAMSISGMLGAVTQGVMTRRDTRSVMVMANAAQTRLSAYLVPSNCVLASTSTSLVIWLNDEMESDTVHASELRWMHFDGATGEMIVEYVSFPSNWSKVMCDLANEDYPKTSDWNQVKTGLAAKGLIDQSVLVDRVASVEITLDAAATSARHVSFDIAFDVEGSTQQMLLSSTIRLHKEPSE